MPVSKAQTFYNDHVTPAIQDWRADEIAIHKAQLVATNLNHMADHYWESYQHDSAKVLGQPTIGEFRRELAIHNPDFVLIRDICDAHKHCKLDRPSRKLTHSDQISTGAMGWGEGRWGEARWSSPEEIVVPMMVVKNIISLGWWSASNECGLVCSEWPVTNVN